MEKIIAHFRKDENGRIVGQPLRDHLVNVAEKMEAAATPWGLGALAKLTGLLHDFLRVEFSLSETVSPFRRIFEISLTIPKGQPAIVVKLIIRLGVPNFYRSVIGASNRKSI